MSDHAQSEQTVLITLQLQCPVCHEHIYDPSARIQYTCGHFMCKTCHSKWNLPHQKKLKCSYNCQHSLGDLHISALPPDLKTSMVNAAKSKGLVKTCEECGDTYFGIYTTSHIKECKRRCIREMCFKATTGQNRLCSSCADEAVKLVVQELRNMKKTTKAGKKYTFNHKLNPIKRLFNA